MSHFAGRSLLLVLVCLVGSGCRSVAHDPDDDTSVDDDDTTAADDDTTAADDDTTAADDDTALPDDDTANADADGDGWIASMDCDDGDPEVHPDAFDWCGDWIDQDCSGTADDETLQLTVPELIDQPFTYLLPQPGDYRGIGRTDLAIATYQMQLRIFHSDGAGDIALTTHVEGPNDVIGIAGADFDGDGDPDVLGSLLSGCPMYRFTNDGAGDLETAVAVPCDGTPYHGVTADVNGDGHHDAVFTDLMDGSVATFLGNGQGGFTQLPSQHAALGAYEVAVADFDGDAAPDLLLSSTVGAVTPLQGNGDGTFTAGPSIGTGASLEIGLAVDVDEDGLDDVVAVLADGDVEVATNLGGFTFGTPAHVDLMMGNLYAAALDLTGDGAPDVVTCAEAFLTFLLNDGNGDLSDSEMLVASLGNGCRPFPVDLDEDGVDELMVSSPLAPGYLLYRTCTP